MRKNLITKLISYAVTGMVMGVSLAILNAIVFHNQYIYMISATLSCVCFVGLLAALAINDVNDAPGDKPD